MHINLALQCPFVSISSQSFYMLYLDNVSLSSSIHGLYTSYDWPCILLTLDNLYNSMLALQNSSILFKYDLDAHVYYSFLRSFWMRRMLKYARFLAG